MPDLRRVRPASSILAAAFASYVLSLALTAPADAYVYWTQPARQTIGRAELGGGRINPSFITRARPQKPGFLAVDANHVYWSYYGGGTIGRANLDGTGIDDDFITATQDMPVGDIAVDSNHIYWVEFDWLPPIFPSFGRADLDGTGIGHGVISSAGPPGGIAINANHIYWTNDVGWDPSWPTYPDTISRANLDGTAVNQSFITGVSNGGGGIAVNADHIYWTNYGLDAIGRANLDGSGVNQGFITAGVDGPVDVTLDADHLYWTNYGLDAIGRANLDGTHVNPRFMTGSHLKDPQGIAVDALGDTSAPKTRIVKGAPNESKKTKLNFKFKSSEPQSTFECKLDQRKWEPCRSPQRVKGLDEGEHKFKVRAIDPAGNVDPSPAKDKFKVVG